MSDFNQNPATPAQEIQANPQAESTTLDDAATGELTTTELQIQKTLEKLERLKEKAAKEKKQAAEKHEKEILAVLKKSGLLTHSKEEWQAKIGEVKMIFEM